MRIFGERLKEIRKDHGHTQNDLASYLGFSVSTVRKWEQGLAEPDLNTLKRICTLYSVSSDFLLALTNLDPLIYEDRFEKLSPEDKSALSLFEKFLSSDK